MRLKKKILALVMTAAVTAGMMPATFVCADEADDEGLIEIEYDEDDDEGLIDVNYDEDVYEDEDLDETEDIEDFDWANADSFTIGDNEYVFDHRIETYLFIGTDDSGNEYDVDALISNMNSEVDMDRGEYKGRMADFLTLLVIDHTDDSFGFLQLDRNMKVRVDILDSNGEFQGAEDMLLCVSHYWGRSPEQSSENTVETVRLALGDFEVINGYYTLHMDDVGSLADLVGGVDVKIEDDMTNVDPSFIKGETVTLDSATAEKFVRARMQVGDGTNEGRMRRQRAYMHSFYDKAMARINSDYNFIDELYSRMKDVAVTDISGNDVGRIAEAVRKGKNKGIFRFDGKTVIEVSPGDNMEHETFYPDETSMVNVLATLFSAKKLDEYGDIDPNWTPDPVAAE